MKTIFTLFASFIITLTTLAYDGTRLSVSSVNRNNDLRVEIDGRKYRMDDNSVTISNLSEGRHTVKIFREKSRRNNRWEWFGNRHDIIYSNTVYLKSGYHLDITINPFGRALVDERRMDRNDDWYDDDNRNGRDRDGRDDRDDRDGRYGNRDNNYNNVVNEQEFRQIKETVGRQWFENTRLSTAKQIADRNYFSSQQVKELVQLFSFENNKLEFAKHAYGRTMDKRNYYIINDAFNYNSSREELDRYIRAYR
jgi:hypothetical protein